MARQRSRLVRDALHQIAVTDKHPRTVIDQRASVCVVARGKLGFGNRQTDGIGEPLPQRAGGDFDAWHMPALRVPGGFAVPLAKALEVVQGQVVSRHEQQAVEQSRPMSGRKHEAVAIGPRRVDGVVLEKLLPQHIGHRRRSKRQAWMPAVGLFHGVDRKESQRVDAQLIHGLN